MQKRDFLFSGNLEYLGHIEQNKTAAGEWKELFADLGGDASVQSGYRPKWDKTGYKNNNCDSENQNLASQKIQEQSLIQAYRKYGHYLCNLDPLGLLKTYNIQEFAPEVVGLLESAPASKLRSLYCQTIGVEFEHIDLLEEKNWLYTEFERSSNYGFRPQEQGRFLATIMEVELFENYLHTKFPGAKRFSIEGSQTCILALEEIVHASLLYDIQEIVFGTAHRGRLATLAKVLGKPYELIFAEFNHAALNTNEQCSGDVKYHMGWSGARQIAQKTIALSLAYNPSHLECVNPVVAGQVRAKQDLLQDGVHKILGVIVHGDSAFCGQGVVAESIAMSGLDGYSSGGAVHIVINNQIGFTANPEQTRASRYPTEFAKIAKLPILHVNGNDVESVVRAIRIALKYRQTFAKDVVVDVFGYRKYGHNEGDEPCYTQPLEYALINNQQSVATMYAGHLLELDKITSSDYAKGQKQIKDLLASKFIAIPDKISPQGGQVQIIPVRQSIIEKAFLQDLANKIFAYPDNFAIHPKLAKLLTHRRDSVLNDEQIDWGTAEGLAFAYILSQNVNIRLSGQDVARGTFSHRHSVLHSQINSSTFVPLSTIAKGRYQVYDSLLSEFGVLGFEYGYSIASDDALVIWEAQFGDFANGAQVIIDQFIASGESKWCQTSNLVCLLPHGYEGQGPEHSSARVERFLSLAARENMIISMPSSPATYFHLLVKHAIEKPAKPLIVFTPKSLLRHKMATCSLDDLCSDFVPVINDGSQSADIKKLEIKKLVFCSGKFYYDLLTDQSTTILRLEQFYPFPEKSLIDILARYPNAEKFLWCQEEPENMGANNFVLARLQKLLPTGKVLHLIAQEAESSPAAGSLHLHNQRQSKLIQQVLNF